MVGSLSRFHQRDYFHTATRRLNFLLGTFRNAVDLEGKRDAYISAPQNDDRVLGFAQEPGFNEGFGADQAAGFEAAELVQVYLVVFYPVEGGESFTTDEW